MNEKLTPEQREWILDKLKEVSLELQDGNVSWTSVNIHRFEQILTAHTAEDECICCLRVEDGIVTPNPDCLQHGGLRGKNPYTTEDEEKLKYLKQKFATSAENWRKLETKIALRKIEEYLAYCRITEERGMWVERPTFDSMKDWLQQEDAPK